MNESVNRAPPGEARKTKGFSGYRPDLEEAVFEFQRNEYPHRRPEAIAPNWRWMFVESAQRLGVEPMVWLYLKEGRVVAHQGAIPVRLHVAGQELTTGWFVETMAAQSVRGSPIGPMVVKKALEGLPLNLSLGQTEQMRQLQFALGWQRVCPLEQHLFVTGHRMDLRKRLPAGLAEAAAFGLGAWYGLKWRWKGRGARSRWRFGRVERFTDEHDALWRAMAESCSCAVVRDASYLNWKYVDRPFARFGIIEMRDGDELAGAAVVMLREPTEAYGYRRGFLVDLVVRLDRPERIRGLIAGSLALVKAEGAETLVCYAAGPAVGRALADLGFARRRPRHYFLVALGGAPDDAAHAMSTPENWFLTLGDSDADAYPG